MIGQEVKCQVLICPLFQAVAADQGRGDPGHNVSQGQHLRHHRLLRRQQDRHEPGTGGYNITYCPVLGHQPLTAPILCDLNSNLIKDVQPLA